MNGESASQGLRLFGGMLIVSGVAGVVVNAMHPVTTGDLAETARQMAAADSWVVLHLVIMLTMVLLVAGLAGMAVYTHETPGEPMARVAMAITLLGGSLAIASLAMDGMALKALADDWSVASQDTASLLGDFVTAKRINNGLWVTSVILFFGLAVTANGVAVIRSKRAPRWVGWGGLICGLGGLTAGLLQVPLGGETRLGEFIFLGSTTLLTIWVVALGYLWWRSAASDRGPDGATPQPSQVSTLA